MYKILELIGEGAWGSVYKAKQLHLSNMFLAIKVLRESLAGQEEQFERFTREAQIISEQDHPNIVKVSNFFELDSGQPCIVMDYLQGESLFSRIRRERRLEPSFLCNIMEQICSALQVVHEQGIVHRDIKPENIFLEKAQDGSIRAKILDFGIASIRESVLSASGWTAGTPAYMSPEQARAEEVDHRTDIWALGVISYLALSENLPYTYQKGDDLKQLHNLEPDPLWSVVRGVNLMVDEVVARAMSIDKVARYKSANSFVEDLVKAFSEYTKERLMVKLDDSKKQNAQIKKELSAQAAERDELNKKVKVIQSNLGEVQQEAKQSEVEVEQLKRHKSLLEFRANALARSRKRYQFLFYLAGIVFILAGSVVYVFTAPKQDKKVTLIKESIEVKTCPEGASFKAGEEELCSKTPCVVDSKADQKGKILISKEYYRPRPFYTMREIIVEMANNPNHCIVLDEE